MYLSSTRRLPVNYHDWLPNHQASSLGWTWDDSAVVVDDDDENDGDDDDGDSGDGNDDGDDDVI